MLLKNETDKRKIEYFSDKIFPGDAKEHHLVCMQTHSQAFARG